MVGAELIKNIADKSEIQQLFKGASLAAAALISASIKDKTGRPIIEYSEQIKKLYDEAGYYLYCAIQDLDNEIFKLAERSKNE